ncbi:MAG: hypothetical protein N2Z60_06655 [Elusimicrobiales bacterium]|nr:hypothetical protein [Elusimicrobiales bacterium]
MADKSFSYFERMKFINKYRALYHKSSKNAKSEIIKLISKALGYHPKHVIRLLNDFKNAEESQRLKIIGRGRKKQYNSIKTVISDLWEQFGYIWSKRLKAVISENINWIISKYNLKDEQINLICNISSSSIDRILRHYRIKHKKRLYSQTRPGSLLRREIPIIIEVADNINRPGHIQIDLVAHCGNSVSGEFLWTLNATDIFSQWTQKANVY